MTDAKHIENFKVFCKNNRLRLREAGDFLPIANQDEVEEIFQVPLDFFLDTRNLEHQYRIYDQIKWSVYSYNYQEYYIWGLTAQIMRKFCSLI